MDEETVKVDPQERHVSDFDWILSQHHMGDGLIYETTRVVVRKGQIVDFRAHITAGRQQIEVNLACLFASLLTLPSLSYPFFCPARRSAGTVVGRSVCVSACVCVYGASLTLTLSPFLHLCPARCLSGPAALLP